MEARLNKNLVSILFAFYIVIVIFLSLFGVSGNLHFVKVDDVSNNFIPFHTLSNYILNFNRYNLDTWFLNTLALVICFIPIGLMIPYIFKRISKYFHVFIFSLVISLIVETTQILTKFGVFDIDDIILSIIGASLGYFMHRFFKNNKETY
jgi:glycopeptide antibiotics resistance protein